MKPANDAAGLPGWPMQLAKWGANIYVFARRLYLRDGYLWPIALLATTDHDQQGYGAVDLRHVLHDAKVVRKELKDLIHQEDVDAIAIIAGATLYDIGKDMNNPIVHNKFDIILVSVEARDGESHFYHGKTASDEHRRMVIDGSLELTPQLGMLTGLFDTKGD